MLQIVSRPDGSETCDLNNEMIPAGCIAQSLQRADPCIDAEEKCTCRRVRAANTSISGGELPCKELTGSQLIHEGLWLLRFNEGIFACRPR